MEPVSETIDFPLEEEKILKYWEEIDAFQECLRQAKGKPRFTFYDGPPFATGLPHYGHILAGSIKDVVTRYAHQNGHFVQRRFGWDCHGLPVEFEIDKKLDIKGPEDVERIGIEAYNAECRSIVMRYANEWRSIVTRIGRWIDFDNDYKTLYPEFMESVWWVFSELYKKGLVYRGVKVMPYSTTCNTPLSNFESGQNYKEVTDPAVVVSFPCVDDPSVAFLAWTTTPWTLPSNLALCVNPNLTYVKIQDRSTAKFYIVMEARLLSIYKTVDDYIILERMPGYTLEGKKYIPAFPYFESMASAFRVLTDGYVTEDSGTGVVHQAPYFGEDDYRVCLKFNVITKEQEPVCPVDASGKFQSPVSDYVGKYVKDADKEIIQNLKHRGRLFSANVVKHNYPFCWRSETPLIYKAVPSWFIRVQDMSESLLKSNRDTYWVPEFVKEKRFGNWLREARDWAVSRNRYWGTPIPIWISDDGEEILCVSSIKELETLSGAKITDLHRERIDHLTIPSKRPGHPPLKRIKEVFDCWFESGSMPYAQNHYPFENEKDFSKIFPADFIAEGIDQTRGWFYTLLVISTALFNQAPFKNLIVNGLVLASDGQKMSKSKKNFPDPSQIIDKYGADALRLYLINSPVVRAESLRFKEEGVKDILKDVLLPWYNAYRFFIQHIMVANEHLDTPFSFNENLVESNNIMDRWILSFTQSLNIFVRQEMAAYRLYTVVPRLITFIQNLTNWYVRMNRRRLKGESGLDDSLKALSTLGTVLLSMIRLMAPYTPFITEKMYQNIKTLCGMTEKSIHWVQMHKPRMDLIDLPIERAVSKMQTVIELGRVVRDRKTIPVKYPLKEIIIILNDEESVSDLQSFEKYIKEELNVRNVVLSTDKKAYGVTLKAEPEHKTLGLRLKGEFKTVMSAIKALKDSEIQKLQEVGSISVCGHTIGLEDVRIMFSCYESPSDKIAQFYDTHGDKDILVLLDTSPDDEMVAEGTAREVINRVQKMRKRGLLVPTDKIRVFYHVEPPTSKLASVVTDYEDYICTAIRAPFEQRTVDDPPYLIIKEKQKIKDGVIELYVSRVVSELADHIPVCRYCTVCLAGGFSARGISRFGTILLENPRGQNFVQDYGALFSMIRDIFTLIGHNYTLRMANGDRPPEDILDLHQQTICVLPREASEVARSVNVKALPLMKFANVTCGDRQAVIVLENPWEGHRMYKVDCEIAIRAIFRLTTKPQGYVFDGDSIHNSKNITVIL